jgi:integrase
VVRRRRVNSPATVRQKVACMTKMLNHYHKRGVLKTKPHFETDPIGDNLRDRVIDREEEADLFALFLTKWDHVTFRRIDGHTGADWHAFWVLLVDTGARPSEARGFDAKNLRGSLLTIKASAVDEDGNRVRTSKTGKDRTLPLTKRALEAFEHLKAAYGNQPCAWARPDAIRHAWDWARGALGLTADEGFIPYALRHTCATRLYDKTRDIVLVKDWLGHTDLKMTMRYAKLMPGALEAARDLLDADQPPGLALAT